MPAEIPTNPGSLPDKTPFIKRLNPFARRESPKQANSNEEKQKIKAEIQQSFHDLGISSVYFNGFDEWRSQRGSIQPSLKDWEDFQSKRWGDSEEKRNRAVEREREIIAVAFMKAGKTNPNIAKIRAYISSEDYNEILRKAGWIEEEGRSGAHEFLKAYPLDPFPGNESRMQTDRQRMQKEIEECFDDLGLADEMSVSFKGFSKWRSQRGNRQSSLKDWEYYYLTEVAEEKPLREDLNMYADTFLESTRKQIAEIFKRRNIRQEDPSVQELRSYIADEDYEYLAKSLGWTSEAGTQRIKEQKGLTEENVQSVLDKLQLSDVRYASIDFDGFAKWRSQRKENDSLSIESWVEEKMPKGGQDPALRGNEVSYAAGHLRRAMINKLEFADNITPGSEMLRQIKEVFPEDFQEIEQGLKEAKYVRIGRYASWPNPPHLASNLKAWFEQMQKDITGKASASKEGEKSSLSQKDGTTINERNFMETPYWKRPEKEDHLKREDASDFLRKQRKEKIEKQQEKMAEPVYRTRTTGDFANIAAQSLSRVL